MEERLDKLLVDRGLVTSRTRGEELIRKGDVLVNGVTCDKPGKKVALDASILLLNEEISWVSRAALKLLKAIDTFSIDVSDRTFLDIGASTGGFTEVLLSKNASHVYCVDVGHGQLHERIRQAKNITNIEKTNIRELTKDHVPTLVDGIVIDVSFISLEKVLPFTTAFVDTYGILIALIKPQFELDKRKLNKNGVVRSSLFYPEVIEKITKAAQFSNYEVIDVIDSPITGGDGNKEFLMYARKK
jgi:23S rRNA (cytidine1920-2'-O)/16S rRNA (cytidine1409-2'-O)-methyltransferase